MASVIIPVLLCFFLGPGAGQLYNREYKKGAFLICASLLILIVAGVWYYKTLQPYIPNDLTTVDPAAMQQILQNATGQITNTETHVLLAFEAALTALWLYGCIDAYLVAKNKGRV
jgi:TM2 domain-containing membrane protein YozV